MIEAGGGGGGMSMFKNCLSLVCLPVHSHILSARWNSLMTMGLFGAKIDPNEVCKAKRTYKYQGYQVLYTCTR
ncbi:unnamed protein product [Cylindrotheca closterium]|uniref:Uncharacterized protein n=1 Tax=Cylindrotheca closterium TaxID=2856 RepID=A0AAD2CIK2_9STRA|nr:unnamed protein product [Cylindrotheca closterium]